MRSVFRDQDIEKKFQKEGYAIIPFLDSSEVEMLKNAYFELLPASGGNITPDDIKNAESHEITYDFTFIDKNIDFKRAVFEVITKAFEKHATKWLADYKPIIANYIRKKNAGGEVPLHQNWAFIDERKCTSVSIWCPLVDSNEENGTLQVVPGSHKRFGENRGPMIPWELENIKEEIINNYLVPCNIQAGQAVVLDDSIVHYSAINKTAGLRLAIQLILIPEELESIHYHMDPQKDPGLIEILEVDREFYMEFNPWKKPENTRCIKKIRVEPAMINVKDFNKKLKGSRIDEKKSNLVSRLKSILKS